MFFKAFLCVLTLVCITSCSKKRTTGHDIIVESGLIIIEPGDDFDLQDFDGVEGE